MNSFGSNLRRWEFWKELISFRSIVIVSPIFLLTVKHWTNLVVLVMFVGSLFFLLRKKEAPLQDTDELRHWRWIIALTLTGPVLAVGMGQLLRGEFYPPNFDAPFRIALCATIFCAISRGWLSIVGKEPITFLWVKYTFPSMLLFTFLFRPSWSTHWGVNRVTTYFVDALTFGNLTLLFSMLCFATITALGNRLTFLERVFLGISFFIGIYLSVMSGSRTGWLGVPVLLYVWMVSFALSKYGKTKTFAIVFTVLITLSLLVPLQPILLNKIILIYSEISQYKWDDINPDNSVGMRVSFYRMGYFYFMEKPLIGWGDLGWMQLIDSPEIIKFTTSYTREFAKNGFHNEYITSAVRSGLWGLVSSICLFLLPLIFISKFNNQRFNIKVNLINLFFNFFIIHTIISSITTEVTNLVFLSSFNGLTIAVFAGEILLLLKNKARKSV